MIKFLFSSVNSRTKFFMGISFILYLPFEIATTYFIGPFVNNISNSSDITASSAQLFLVIIFLKFGSQIFYTYSYSKFVYDFQSDLSNRLMGMLLSLDPYKYESKTFGEYTQKVVKDVDYLREHLVPSIIEGAAELIIVLCLLGVIFYVTPTGFLLMSLTFLISALIYYFMIIRRVKVLGAKRQIQEKKRMSSIEILLASITDLRQYGSLNVYLKPFKDANKELASIGMLQKFFQSIPRVSIDFFILIILFLLAIWGTTGQQSIIADMASIGYATYRIVPSFTKIANSFNGFAFSKDCVNSVQDFIAFCEKNYKPQTNLSMYSSKLLEKHDVDLCFKNHKFTFSIGSKILLTGPSGSGKSTFLRSIIGHGTETKISINSKDYFSVNDFYRSILVPQKSILFPGTVLDNLLIDNKDQEKEAMQLIKIFELCQPNEVEGFINQKIGSNQIGISGGQMQRICLIRALIRSPNILLLDESLSGVHSDLELKILKYITIRDDMTVIYVSHNTRIESISWHGWAID